MKLLARSELLFVVFALIAALIITRATATQPGYTDAYYYYNAGHRLATGQGLTDAYLWNYLNAPDHLPAESFRYWMPLPALLVAAGQMFFGESYGAAQLPFTLAYAGIVITAYALGWRIGGARRHAWMAGLIALFSGFYLRFWGTTGTFAPYGLFGALCLLCIGASFNAGVRRKGWLFFLAGLCAGLGHLTRADGLLLLAAVYAAILWEWWRIWRKDQGGNKLLVQGLIVSAVGYLLVMTPWFARNLDLFGSILPPNGIQAIWFTQYDDIFSYPPDANTQTFFADGVGLLLRSRWEALSVNLPRFFVEQGLIVLAPLMLIALWRRRADPFLRAFWIYALVLHIVMTFVFAYPGYRGGLFHSAAALIPWWAALGVVGLDDVVDWIARRRRRWNAATAKAVFAPALVIMALLLSITAARPFPVPELYSIVNEQIPLEARVMINDPAALYYFTGRGGVVLPNEAPDVIPQIAAQYDVDYLLIQFTPQPDGQLVPEIPSALYFDFDNPPVYLQPLPFDAPNVRLYAIRP